MPNLEEEFLAKLNNLRKEKKTDEADKLIENLLLNYYNDASSRKFYEMCLEGTDEAQHDKIKDQIIKKLSIAFINQDCNIFLKKKPSGKEKAKFIDDFIYENDKLSKEYTDARLKNAFVSLLKDRYNNFKSIKDFNKFKATFKSQEKFNDLFIEKYRTKHKSEIQINDESKKRADAILNNLYELHKDRYIFKDVDNYCSDINRNYIDIVTDYIIKNIGKKAMFLKMNKNKPREFENGFNQIIDDLEKEDKNKADYFKKNFFKEMILTSYNHFTKEEDYKQLEEHFPNKEIFKDLLNGKDFSKYSLDYDWNLIESKSLKNDTTNLNTDETVNNTKEISERRTKFLDSLYQLNRNRDAIRVLFKYCYKDENMTSNIISYLENNGVKDTEELKAFKKSQKNFIDAINKLFNKISVDDKEFVDSLKKGVFDYVLCKTFNNLENADDYKEIKKYIGSNPVYDDLINGKDVSNYYINNEGLIAQEEVKELDSEPKESNVADENEIVIEEEKDISNNYINNEGLTAQEKNKEIDSKTKESKVTDENKIIIDQKEKPSTNIDKILSSDYYKSSILNCNINKYNMNKAFLNFKQKMDWFSEDYWKSRNIDFSKINNNDYSMDPRELKVFCISKIGTKNLSKDDFFKECDKILNEVKTNRYQMLDEYYNVLENFDYDKTDYETEYDCFKLLLRARLNQLDSGMLSINKDFKKDRYDFDLGQKRKLDMLISIGSQFFAKVTEEISSIVGYDVNTLKKGDFPKLSNIEKERNEFFVNTSIVNYGFGKENHITLEIPEYAYYADKINNNKKVDKNISDKYVTEDYNFKNDDTFMKNLYEVLNNYDSTSGRLLSNTEPYDNIYIDGKPLSSLVKNPSNDPIIKSTKYNSVLMESIKDGKAIEVARSYELDGKFHTEIVPIEFKTSKELNKKIQEDYVKKHYSFFRRLFDWGPLKIKREDRLKKSFESLSKNKDDRHMQILLHRNTVILDKVNENIKGTKLIRGELKENINVLKTGEFSYGKGENFIDSIKTMSIKEEIQNKKEEAIKNAKTEEEIQNIEKAYYIDNELDPKHHEKAHRNKMKIVDDFKDDYSKNEFLKEQSAEKEKKLANVYDRLADFLGKDMLKEDKDLTRKQKVEKVENLIKYVDEIREKNPKKYNKLQEQWNKDNPTKPYEMSEFDKYLNIDFDYLMMQMKLNLYDHETNKDDLEHTKIIDKQIEERNQRESIEISEEYLNMPYEEFNSKQKSYANEREKERNKNIEQVYDNVSNEISDKINYTLSEEYQEKIQHAKDKLIEEIKQNNPKATANEIDDKSRLVLKEFNQINFEDDKELNNTNRYKELADVAGRRFIIKNIINKVDPSISNTKTMEIIDSIGFSIEALDEEIATMTEALKKINKGEEIKIEDFEPAVDISIERDNMEALNIINSKDKKEATVKVEIDKIAESMTKK